MRITTAGIVFLGLAVISAPVLVYAQDCTPGRDLVTIPEIKSQGGLLRGVITLADEERSLAGSADGSTCNTQHLRYLKGHSLIEPPVAWPSGGDILPGPTLRARVGDQVQLAFLNQINLANFPISLDRAERGDTEGCDIATATRKNAPMESRQIYPQNPDLTPGDTHPNCLHGSSTANIHFHGTHTTPSTTGDNVLLYVRPALREGGEIKPATENVMQQIQEIWDTCRQEGPPTQWSQLPEAWRVSQTALLKEYDATAPYKGVVGALPQDMQLWPKNEEQLSQNPPLWPQYSLGAFPYCFNLPAYDPPTMKMGQAPGTHWYHAHKHGSTALNVNNGMAGAFIIEGAYDDALKAFYGPDLKEQVLVIQQLETALSLLSARHTRQTSAPPLSVNGRLNPVVTMRPGEVQMWRVVNAAARDFVQFDSFTSHGVGEFSIQWRQIAQDGVQFSYENYQRVGTLNRKFNLAGANRADLLVKAPTHKADYELQVVRSVSDNPSAAPVTLLTVRVTGDPVSPEKDFIGEEGFPAFPAYLADIPEDEARLSRPLVYDTTPSPGRRNKGKMPRHTINGKQFDGERFDKEMWLNTVEEWKMINKTVGIAHPFHIHINPFQIVEVFQPTVCDVDPVDPSTWVPCETLTPPFVWWDTFAIPSAKAQELDESVCTELAACPPAIKRHTTCTAATENKPATCTVKIPGYFKMRSRFVDFTGAFVNHCHILAHEDRGMMQLIAVVDPPINPWSHD